MRNNFSFVFTWRKGNRNVLFKTKKAGHPRAICFLFSVYMQRVVIGPSVRIFLALGSSSLSDRLILALAPNTSLWL